MRAEKTILLLIVLTFLALFPPDPVITARKLDNSNVEKIPFTNDCTLVAGSASAGEQIISETGIIYVNDAISTGEIFDNPESPISGNIWVKLSGTYDTNTLLGSFDGKWVITSVGGTFEGSIVGTVAIADVSGKFVGHGTNTFQGQKIKGSFEGTVNNYFVTLSLQGELTSKAIAPKSKKEILPVRGVNLNEIG